MSALSVAAAKIHAVATAEDEIVLAADTLVVADDEVLGKPAHSDAARSMLRRLRGRAHQVLTGVALRRGPTSGAECVAWGGVVSTRVIMRHYAEADIDAYVARGEPFDKAGGYAIQDDVFRPAEGLDGCYLNVVGLPLCGVVAGLEALGVVLPAEAPSAGPPPCGLCRAGAPRVSIRSLS